LKVNGYSEVGLVRLTIDINREIFPVTLRQYNFNVNSTPNAPATNI
jgi:hypothetical protein